MTSDRQPTTAGCRLFAWPGRAHLLVTGGLALAFALFWLLVYGGANLVTGLHSFRIPLSMRWERLVPFVPELAGLYLSLQFLMLLSLLVFRTWQAVIPVLTVLMVQTLIAGICFVLLPIQPVSLDPMVIHTSGWLFRIADAFNLEFNAFPSLHVSYAFTTAIAIGTRCGPWGKTLFMAWASAIALSTLLLHQHAVIDVLAGMALAAFTWRWIYTRARQPAFLQAVRAELLCLVEFYYFSRRHRRYLVIGLLIYWYSLWRWQALRVIRVGFCLLQHLDDILDGDRPCDGEPSDIADDLVRQMQQGVFGEDARSCLAHCLWEDMGRFQTAHDHPRQELIALIRLMQYDRLRVCEQHLLAGAELAEHHRQTFYYAVNLMLTLGGAELRAHDAADLIAAFGWCSTLRDLQEDLAKGLVNLPSSVIATARTQGLTTIEYPAILHIAAVQQWLQDEYTHALQCLARFEQTLPQLSHKRGVAILRLFHRSIQRFAVKVAQRYGLHDRPGYPSTRLS